MIIPGSETFHEVLPLGPQLSISMVKDWLRVSGKDLTAAQFGVVQKALDQCSLPLYTSLVFEEVGRWCSYMALDQAVLEETVSGIINKLFDRIELYHGFIFVVHTLSY